MSFMCTLSLFRLFFFQAEDGIRYGHVTGVQTCALPISEGRVDELVAELWRARLELDGRLADPDDLPVDPELVDDPDGIRAAVRSEERRVGKECGGRGWP